MLYDIESTTFTRINYFGSHPLLTIVCYRKVLCIIDRCYPSNSFSLNKSQVFVLHLSPFFDRIRTTGFLLLLPCSHGLLVRLLFTCYLVSIATLARNFIAVYTLLLCILQGLHPSGFSLCITRIKNLFFEKKQIKLFVAFVLRFIRQVFRM